MKCFFSYVGPGCGFEMHDTLAEAKAVVIEHLEGCREDAGSEGWPECVEDAYYGSLVGRVVETERMPWVEHMKAIGMCEEGEEDECRGDFDEYVEYAVKDDSHDEFSKGVFKPLHPISTREDLLIRIARGEQPSDEKQFEVASLIADKMASFDGDKVAVTEMGKGYLRSMLQHS